ncbi:tRNA/rRNA methyltransferase [Perkinsela sp. CCAP 1560/4]|nr:tRNA/rRNA methyltransferase [Perkinsela sp. CCAP 1560/4]|eukprot:KNH09520.1 tRNA/rRNA methyltransferase [Perkinsela sp. CCAP 1560/4]
MICRSVATLATGNWRELYHRIHGPRRLALAKWMKNKEILGQPGACMRETVPEHADLPKKGYYDFETVNVTEKSRSNAVGKEPAYIPKVPTHKARYNKWWVSNNGDFVEQFQIIEDPRVIERRQTTLPDPTHENLWKKNQCPFFTPFDPYVKVVNYPKDPDAKHLYSATIPKWKDFMTRKTPPLPRTWY